MTKIICYGCGKQALEFKRMRVQYIKEKQLFCLECYSRLIKIKLGLI